MNLDQSLSCVARAWNVPPSTQVLGLTLSRSNLETLLAKLDTDGSHATILRQVSDGDDIAGSPLVVVVKAEEDAAHYNARARQADVRGSRGAMLEDGATWPGQSIAVNPPEETL